MLLDHLKGVGSDLAPYLLHLSPSSCGLNVVSVWNALGAVPEGLVLTVLLMDHARKGRSEGVKTPTVTSSTWN